MRVITKGLLAVFNALGFLFWEAMMTQLELARKGIILPQMRAVAEQEGVEAEFVRQGVANGTIVISANAAHKGQVPCGIGQGLRTKVNANIGTSSDYGSVETELAKLQVAVECGADTVMDLSTGGDISAIRREIIAASTIPVGTVPVSYTHLTLPTTPYV